MSRTPHGTIPPLVERHLDAHPRQTPSQIAAAVGHNPSAVKRVLASFKRKGRVQSDEFGRYWLAEQAPGGSAAPRALPPPDPDGAAILFTLDSHAGPIVGYDLNSGRFVQMGTPPGVPATPVGRIESA
jgi:hypothetical protein